MKLFAKKSLGQHFLNSPTVLAKIIEAAHIQEGDRVLEIGPGTGFLTRTLLDTGARVTAIEKDARAIDMLNQTFFNEIKNGQLKLVAGDVLDQNVITSNLLVLDPYLLVANIPYYITGAILEQFLEHGPRPQRMVLLVQKEVADRIVARDGKESVLSVSVKVFGTPKMVSTVPPGAFTPPPSVDSAILAIENISSQHFASKNADIARFFTILKAGFAHKRKFAARNLESVLPAEQISHIWTQNALDPKIRAEDISIEKWLSIGAEC
jgi:16S rRNA (adenine1518-N6/adenine1519-N6)-dimethyltransferase